VTERRSDKPFKRPESVLVVVHTPALEILLLERVTPPGFWQSVTGSLHCGESVAAAPAREVREETGLDPAGLIDAESQSTFPIAPEWRRRYAPGVTENLEHWWYLAVPRPCNIELNSAEHVRYGWLELPAALAQASSSTNRAAIERLRDA
jgi:dATP pyrophosphohydrolase